MTLLCQTILINRVQLQHEFQHTKTSIYKISQRQCLVLSLAPSFGHISISHTIRNDRIHFRADTHKGDVSQMSTTLHTTTQISTLPPSNETCAINRSTLVLTSAGVITTQTPQRLHTFHKYSTEKKREKDMKDTKWQIEYLYIRPNRGQHAFYSTQRLQIRTHKLRMGFSLVASLQKMYLHEKPSSDSSNNNICTNCNESIN